jgi:hypothetical protein
MTLFDQPDIAAVQASTGLVLTSVSRRMRPVMSANSIFIGMEMPLTARIGASTAVPGKERTAIRKQTPTLRMAVLIASTFRLLASVPPSSQCERTEPGDSSRFGLTVLCHKLHRAGSSVARCARPGRESTNKEEPQARTR